MTARHLPAEERRSVTVETVLAQLVVAAAIILVAVFGRRSRSGAETSTEVRR